MPDSTIGPDNFLSWATSSLDVATDAANEASAFDLGTD